MSGPTEISVRDLHRTRQESPAPIIVDVREEWERDIVALEGAVAIPLGAIVERAAELPKDKQVMVICHHGSRSARATAWLRQNGWNATNVEGGIDAWAEQVDTSLARY